MKTLHLYLLASLCVFSAVYMIIWSSDSGRRFRCSKLDFSGQCIDESSIKLEDIIRNIDQDRANCSSDLSRTFDNALIQGAMLHRKVFLTIGIPTLKRPEKACYVLDTIGDLLNKSTTDEHKELILLVFLGDFDYDARAEINASISAKFEEHLNSGVIQIIQAARSFYPSLENLERTYGHSVTKVKWRSKQNFDYAFMMLYSRGLSEYYLQLEDDVSTVPGYIGIIKDFIAKQRKKWTCLEYSVLGFIAKLYHSYDLEKLAKLLMLFYYEQPNDVTYLSFNQLKLQEHRIVRKPTIFKHHGFYSTLGEKRETRPDPLYEEVEDTNKTRNGSASGGPREATVVNPPATIISSLHVYDNNTPQNCYSKTGLMWTNGPNKGDRLLIVFMAPQKITSVLIVTGPDDHPDDFIQHGVLQIGQSTDKLSNGKSICSGIIATEKFKSGRAQIKLDASLKKIDITCVQILILESQRNWLQVSEITIRAIQK